jgi:iron-sulfur cluster assembly protein
MSEVIQHNTQANPGIVFTDAAIKHLISYLGKNLEYRGIRLSVKKTGCSGLSYVVDYVMTPNEADFKESLTGNYSVWVDRSSYPYLKNMEVDYVKQGLNYKFVFSNPNQTGQCGCGESFTVT